MTMTRWQTISAYFVLLIACCAGVFRIGPWAVVASASLLALISLVANRTAFLPHAGTVAEPVLVLSHILNSAAIASAAYIFGFIARWAWGL